MIKIALTGKANSGKNTTAKLLVRALRSINNSTGFQLGYPIPVQYIAFADPIKQIARQIFPKIPRKWLYGPSYLRNEIIPGAFKNGQPLTVRQLLIDIGNDFGRAYDNDIWVRNFDLAYQKACKKYGGESIIIATDTRRRNEFDFLRANGFYHIRILRNECAKIDDISETDQDTIQDREFDYVIHNDYTKAELKQTIQQIALIVGK